MSGVSGESAMPSLDLAMQGNALLREALRLACEDGWDDGQWAMRRYIEMAQASLSARTEAGQ